MTLWFMLPYSGPTAHLIPYCPFPSPALLLCQHSLSWHSQHLCGPEQHPVQITQPALTSEADHGVKTVFHLPLTCFLRTLQWYYCLKVLALSHLAASLITPSNTAPGSVTNKSLFHHGLSCDFSLNSQNHHTFPIQVSPKNFIVPSSYKLKIIIKALGCPFLWVSQWPWLTVLTENTVHTKKWAHWQLLETNELSPLCSSTSLLPQSHVLQLHNNNCFSIFCYIRGWRKGGTGV